MKENSQLLTAHIIVKNEEQWVWYAIQSVLPYVDRLLILDTGSTDDTIKIIKTIKNKKISFDEVGAVDANGLVGLRNKQIEQTRTPWFVIVDGDEVWRGEDLKNIRNQLADLDKKIMACFVRTNNCVGDLWHIQPQSAGKYQIAGEKGHLNIRFFRIDPQHKWRGTYPLEAYSDSAGNKVNDNSDKLHFFDVAYWHMTHMTRSRVRESETVARIGKKKYEIGIKIDKNLLPEAFSLKRPSIVPSPWVKPSKMDIANSFWQTPIKILKRKITK